MGEKRDQFMRANSRDLILQAALQLFSKQGYDGTSIDDIRQAAGFKSKASLYTHFTSKEEVATALLHQIQENQQGFIGRAAIPAGDDPLQRLIVIARAFIEWGMIYPQEYAFTFLRIQQEILVRGEATYMELPSSQVFVNLLQLVRAQGYPVRRTPDVALMSMAIGLISRAVIDRLSFGSLSQEEIVQQVLEACFGVLFAEPVALPTIST